MHQTIDQLLHQLRQEPGIDLFRLRNGNRIIVETGDCIYELTLLDHERWIVSITATDRRVRGGTVARFLSSVYDREGRAALNGWIGRGLRMQIQFSNGVLQSTPVLNATVVGMNESGDGWRYDVF